MFAKFQRDVESILKNKSLIFVIAVLTSLFTVFAGPELPESVVNVLNNGFVKTLIIFVVAYLTCAKDPRVALFVSILFIGVTNMISEKSMYEKFTNYKVMENFQDEMAEEEDSEDKEEEEKGEEVEEENPSDEENEIEEETETKEKKKPMKLKLKCTAVEEQFNNYY
jgi:hypothetical protein